MSKKREYLKVLRNYPSKWILSSAKNPTAYMTKIEVLLHYVVLKERGFYEQA